MLTFSQVNLHKANLATTLAGQSMEGQKQRVMLITEPYSIQARIPYMPKGVRLIYTRSLTDCSPRAAIAASPDLLINQMDTWCTRDCAVGTVKLHGKQTLIISLYCDIKLPVASDHLLSLLRMAERRKFAVILVMDSNCHSVLFGPDGNKRGEDLEDLILDHGLQVENIGNVPTYETRRGDRLIQTHIDLTLSRDLGSPVSDWKVDRSYNASDHNSISFTIPPSTEQVIKQIRPWGSAKWDNFKRCLDDFKYFEPAAVSMKKLDKMVSSLYTAIEQALNQACPKIDVDPCVSNNKWSTEKHVAGKNRVSRLYAIAKKTGSERDWVTYREADRQFKRLCHKDRNRAWRRYKESIQTEKETASLARLAQRIERREVGVLKNTEGTTLPGKETIDFLTKTHFPASTPSHKITYNNRRNASTSDIKSKYTDWITPDLIRQSLAGFEKKKSPGPDAVSYTHLTLPTTPYV